jgi:hypothetical protein
MYVVINCEILQRMFRTMNAHTLHTDGACEKIHAFITLPYIRLQKHS